jgi:hypothetical protein
MKRQKPIISPNGSGSLSKKGEQSTTSDICSLNAEMKRRLKALV